MNEIALSLTGSMAFCFNPQLEFAYINAFISHGQGFTAPVRD